MHRTAQLYLLIIGIAGFGIFLMLRAGSHLPSPGSSMARPFVAHAAPEETVAIGASLGESVRATLQQNASDPLSRLFLQLFVVIGVSFFVAWIFTRCGQPAVVGEMMAGVLLGPSLFGFLAPHAFQFVFAPSSLEPLRLFSQIGVCLFMFAVGMEMDLSELRQKAHTAIVVSHASIITPCLFGVALALLLYERLAQPGASFSAFALFMAISMSITAFPVLIRILQDRGMFRSSLGRTAAACAAVGDVTAWGLLAFVVAFAKAANTAAAACCLALVLIFVAVMLFVVKPNLPRWLGKEALERLDPTKGVLAIVIGIVLASALCTQLIGIRALFGAFVAGLIMPTAGNFRDKLVVRVENISSVLLLPVFFAFTGLRTEIGLLHDASDWLICLLIIVIATIGKLGGSAITARLTGTDWCESLQLGALMNTRGLMELIALNIGYELGILSQRVFSMLVIMALVTTIMTGPLLTLFGRRRRIAPSIDQEGFFAQDERPG
jgi:Kef-type K+ transport system membrane component KefB